MAKRASSSELLARQSIKYGLVFLLAAMPFYALSYVWLGSNFGHIQWFKIWPELLISALTVPASWLFATDAKMRAKLAGRKINWLILAYLVLHVLLALWKRPEADALIAGLMINLRLVAVLLLGQMVAIYWPDKQTIRYLSAAVIIPAGLTIIFGVLQATVLPINFLRWFGYDRLTIRPYTSLHEGSTLLRYSSTLRGPNPFGAYLVFVISFLVGWLTRPKIRRMAIIGLSLTVVALVWTFSRSAWIAALIAVLLHAYLDAKPAHRTRGLQVGAAVVIVLAGLVFAFHNNVAVENSVLHTDKTNGKVNSNDGHLSALKEGLSDIKANPLGTGPGSAGPASVNLKKSPARIAENYYIQVAQEVGVFGLVLFLLIFGLIMKQLFSRQTFGWPHALFISGVGLMVANLMLHVWADDTLGVIWWGMAGYFAFLPGKRSLAKKS